MPSVGFRNRQGGRLELHGRGRARGYGALHGTRTIARRRFGGASVDIYALGAVLYECLSGESPHCAGRIQELMFKILNEQVPRLDRSRPGVPKGLADAVARALAKSPAQRFADVQEFATAIHPYARPAIVDELDLRSATVDLERDGNHPTSKRATRRKSYAAIVLSGIIGLAMGCWPTVPCSGSAGERADSRLLRPVNPVLPVPSEARPHRPFLRCRQHVRKCADEQLGPGKSARQEPGAPPPAMRRTRFDSENPYGL